LPPHLLAPITATIATTWSIVIIEPVRAIDARKHRFQTLGQSIRLVTTPITTGQLSHQNSTSALAFLLAAMPNGDLHRMTVEEKRAMKAACVQAAATLIAARDNGNNQIDVEECIRLAALLYVRVVTADWREPS
jgi:hypothetical protein